MPRCPATYIFDFFPSFYDSFLKIFFKIGAHVFRRTFHRHFLHVGIHHAVHKLFKRRLGRVPSECCPCLGGLPRGSPHPWGDRNRAILPQARVLSRCRCLSHRRLPFPAECDAYACEGECGEFPYGVLTAGGYHEVFRFLSCWSMSHMHST